MSRARILAVAGGLLLAAPVLPAAADGLGQFQELLRQAPPGVLSYQTGKPLGENGFVLEGVTVKPPPEATEGIKTEEPIQIDRIAVEDFDFASQKKNEPPNFAKLRAEGISIDTKSFDTFDLRELTGRDTIKADFQLDYRIDPERKTMMLNRLELDLRELARIELSLALDGIDPNDRMRPPRRRYARPAFVRGPHAARQGGAGGGEGKRRRPREDREDRRRDTRQPAPGTGCRNDSGARCPRRVCRRLYVSQRGRYASH